MLTGIHIIHHFPLSPFPKDATREVLPHGFMVDLGVIDEDVIDAFLGSPLQNRLPPFHATHVSIEEQQRGC